MVSIFSKPVIASCEENQDSCILTVHFKSKKCGFIKISRERVIFQFSCGWNTIGKGAVDIAKVLFIYENSRFIVSKISDNKEIFALRCNQDLYNIVYDFLSSTKRRREPE
ncbi:hypothetical protein [Pedobacter caeni]|uniref:PH domain-containing protein n=1 Tax=Pedobacter caeni TaxID=288992 RepID=A0A1M4V8C0_9SPHI|nr:hypothetical protein [Pedobacter caeni]SHE65204.1 hypothetical protein SAMN04488522_101815 [Pedobacter caeni]